MFSIFVIERFHSQPNQK
ncbi:TPA: erythromycin resistance leader peptide [Streptococcus pyogenes]